VQAALNNLAGEAQRPIAQELDFLIQRTGQDELTLLSRAARLGLGLLYRQTAEQAFIDETLTRAEAVAALGPQHPTAKQPIEALFRMAHGSRAIC